MRRDLQLMDRICFCGEQELERFQAPQLEAVRPPGERPEPRGDCL